MLTHIYIPGQGYVVRNARGIVIARGLTKEKLLKVLALEAMTVIPSCLLDHILQS